MYKLIPFAFDNSILRFSALATVTSRSRTVPPSRTRSAATYQRYCDSIDSHDSSKLFSKSGERIAGLAYRQMRDHGSSLTHGNRGPSDYHWLGPLSAAEASATMSLEERVDSI